MLFPLGQGLQCKDIGQKVEFSDLTSNHENKGKNPEEVVSASEEKQEYEGPITRAKTKALRQANMLMAQYFDT